MKNKLRVIFFGTESWAIPCIDILIEQHNLVAIVTTADAPSGRGHKLTPSPIKTVALRCKIPVFEPDKLIIIVAELAKLNADIGVVIAYGKLIPDSIIDLFKYGIINCHPSALPYHRGPSPVEAAILFDDPITISVIQLSSEMDAGDILAQLELSGETNGLTAPEMYTTAGLVGAKLIIETIEGLTSKSLRPQPQDHSKATFSTKIAKVDGIIDWMKPAVQIEREVRAYAGWPGSKAVLDGIDITITASHVAAMAPSDSIPSGTPLQTSDGSLAFQTGQGLLVVDRLKPAGKNEMAGRAYLAGHPLSN